MIADEIRALADEHCAAFRDQDPETITRIYADDVKKFDDKGGFTSGRAPIIAQWDARFGALEGTLEMKTLELAEMSAGDLVSEIGEWAMKVTLTRAVRGHGPILRRLSASTRRRAPDHLRVPAAMTAELDPRTDVPRLGLEAHLAELEDVGLTVIPPALAAPTALAQRLVDRLLELAADRNRGVVPDLVTGATHAFGADLAQVSNATGQWMYFLMADESEVFADAMLNPVVLALVEHLIGSDVLLSAAAGSLKGPGGPPLTLHCDQTIPGVPRALVCNVTYALSDYTLEGGALCFVPGSHRLMRQPAQAENFDTPGASGHEQLADDHHHRIEVLRRQAIEHGGGEFSVPPNVVPVEAEAGSIIVWHGNTWHGAFPRTVPGIRISLILYFCNPWLRPEEGYREQLPQAVLDRHDERFARLIGRDVHYGFAEEGPEYAPGAAFARARSRPNANTPRGLA